MAASAEYNSFLDYELGKSKEIIEEHTPGSVTILSLPYGDGAGDAEIIPQLKGMDINLSAHQSGEPLKILDINLFVIPSLPMLDSTESELIGTYLGL